MTYEDLIVTVEDRVGTIEINRADKLNALRQQTFAELSHAVDELTAHPDVRVMVLTASGARSFSTGIDLEADGLPADSIQWDSHTSGNAEVIRKLWYSDLPLLTAVNGYALAGGCNLALIGDLTLAAESASFGEPEIRHGAPLPAAPAALAHQL